MGRRSRNSCRLWAGLLVAAALATNCGGASKGGASATTTGGGSGAPPALSPLATVKQAIAATEASGTARVSNRLLSKITAFSSDEQSVGVFNFKTGDGAWSHNMSATPNGLVPPGTPPDQVVLNVREVDPYLYTSLLPAFKAAGINETWLRVPATPPPGSSGFSGFEGLSPRIPLSARFERPEIAFRILATTTAARLVGPAVVRGKATTEYSIDVQVRSMLEGVGVMFFFGNPTAPADLAKIDETAAKVSTVRVYIDALGRIRELFVDSDLRPIAPLFKPPQDPRFWRELRVQWDFFDYGVPVSVSAPTESVRIAD